MTLLGHLRLVSSASLLLADTEIPMYTATDREVDRCAASYKSLIALRLRAYVTLKIEQEFRDTYDWELQMPYLRRFISAYCPVDL